MATKRIAGVVPKWDSTAEVVMRQKGDQLEIVGYVKVLKDGAAGKRGERVTKETALITGEDVCAMMRTFLACVDSPKIFDEKAVRSKSWGTNRGDLDLIRAGAVVWDMMTTPESREMYSWLSQERKHQVDRVVIRRPDEKKTIAECIQMIGPVQLLTAATLLEKAVIEHELLGLTLLDEEAVRAAVSQIKSMPIEPAVMQEPLEFKGKQLHY